MATVGLDPLGHLEMTAIAPHSDAGSDLDRPLDLAAEWVEAGGFSLHTELKLCRARGAQG